jgi:MFS family permease
MAVRLYAELLRNRQIQIAVGASIVSGLTVGMPLAIVLMVQQQTGDFASAGAVTAALAISASVFGPLRGRTVDRRGQRILPAFASVSVAAIVVLVYAAEHDASLGVLVVLAALVGSTTAPLLPSLRTLWADLVEGPEQLPAAYGLHAVLVEAFFIGGPVVAAALIAIGSPEAAVLGLAGCELVGVFAFAAIPASRRWRGAGAKAGWAGALASAGMVTLTLIEVPFGALFGVLDVAVPAFATAHGKAAAAGLVLAALAVGSLIGGLAFGARSAGRRNRGRRMALLMATFAILLLPTLLAGSLAALGAVVAVAGLVVAPATALFFALIDDVAPAGTATEAASWITTAYTAGLAIGTASAGLIVDGPGTDAAFAVACALGAVAAGIAFARRRTLAGAPAAA